MYVSKHFVDQHLGNFNKQSQNTVSKKPKKNPHKVLLSST